MKGLIQELTCIGIPEQTARLQVSLLARGTRHAQIIRSASIDDGICVLSKEEVDHAVRMYDEKEGNVKVLKFVPASGAATRMFKDLKEYMDTEQRTEPVDHFFSHLDKIPFQELLDSSVDDLSITHQILDSEGLALHHKPKGSILFHRYPTEVRTAFEEHLVEGASYAVTNDQVHIHFTLAPEHMDSIKKDMSQWALRYGKELNCTFDLSFSIQRAITDTICCMESGEPIRTPDGRLKMRPGGHGALIHNLNELDADIIFIKNIDNVVSDTHRADTVRYKKALGGMLIELRKEARRMIGMLKAGEGYDEALIFLRRLGTIPTVELDQEELIRLMNRPYRVCGMVRNEGEPGGGPFWVRKGERETLQIVETAEIDLSQDHFRTMLDQGTHFNPVDLVCCLNDLYGSRKDLLEHVDMDAAFVTDKVVEGQPAKVLEWPGLWNGAMSDWNSLFVEVPISTFNPVKTVNDLLRPMHQ